MRAQSRSFHGSSGERDNESFKEILWKDKSLEIFRKSNWRTWMSGLRENMNLK